MNEIEDLLNNVGITTRVQGPTETTSTVQSMPNEAFDEVLNEMGFNDDSDDTEEQEDLATPMTEEDLRQDVASIESFVHNEISNQITQNNETNTDTNVNSPSLDVAINELAEAITTFRGEVVNETVETVQEEEDDHIEPNSPTLLLDATTSRFSGAEWYTEIQKKNAIIAGLGGIGSWTALQLARMNIAKLVMYDDDIVEAANMSGQLYDTSNVNRLKVNAMAEAISKYTSMRNILAIGEKFTENSEAGDVMICGFDSMKARKTFFNVWYNHVQNKPEEERKNCLFIDGRLSIDLLQILCIRGDDEYNKRRYKKEFLFNDYEAESTVCSLKQTTYLACMIGSLIVNLFTNWVAGLLNPIIPYDLPFFTAYNTQNMIFNTEN